MTRFPLFALLAALAVAAGCAEPDPPPQPMVEPKPLPPPPPPPPAEGPGVDTVYVEGDPVLVNVAPYETPLGFPLPFTARLPEGIAAESVASGEGDAIVFAWEDAEGASLRLFVPADAATDAAAAAELAAAQGATESLSNRPEWSRASFVSPDSNDPYVTVHLTRHADRPLIVTRSATWEMGETLGPRLFYVLDRIRWADTGRLLIDG